MKYMKGMGQKKMKIKDVKEVIKKIEMNKSKVELVIANQCNVKYHSINDFVSDKQYDEYVLCNMEQPIIISTVRSIIFIVCKNKGQQV